MDFCSIFVWYMYLLYFGSLLCYECRNLCLKYVNKMCIKLYLKLIIEDMYDFICVNE